MENVHIWLIVLWASGLFEGRAMEGLIMNVTVRCTNENSSKNEIKLWCNMEKFICSMDVSREKITIDPSSIQQSDTRGVFTARMEGAQNSVLANYSCQTKDPFNMSAVLSSVPDPNTTALPGSHLDTSYRNRSSNKQAKSEEAQERDLQKQKKNDKKYKKKGKKPRKPRRDGKGSDEDSGSREDIRGGAECDNKECDDKDDGQRRGGRYKWGKRPKNGSVHLYIATAISVLVVILLVLVVFSLNQWKKRKMQSTLKAGGAIDQKLQEGDPENKVVTVYVRATNPDHQALPPVYSPTGHIYQEITDTPQQVQSEEKMESISISDHCLRNHELPPEYSKLSPIYQEIPATHEDVAEVVLNPPYTPSGHPSLKLQSENLADGQYSVLESAGQQ